jgi:NAD(P)-dependent dehydrogenase (short-subunit alcohol dehydrogenase family)
MKELKMDIPSPEKLFDFTGKVVLVTGGGSGIGAGIVRRFGQAGATVMIDYRSSREGAERVASEIRKMGGKAATFQADVTQSNQVSELFRETLSTFKKLDVLINNAGTFPLHSLLDMEESDWDYVVNTNLKSAFLCTQLAAQQMVQQGTGGAIVNVSTIEAENPAPMHSHYDAAKAGMSMHARTAALELGRYGIRVNNVAPGLIWKDGIEREWPEGVERWLSKAPLGRLGMPDDVADACLFLASPAARWITGANLVVDGGVMVTQIF